MNPPPKRLNEWRGLDEAGRRAWLAAALDRVSGAEGAATRSKEPGRTVILDGGLIDSLVGFYCAMGEAVNGPGGYFGHSFFSFDDSLFGGYGLEYPYTLIWRRSELSRQALDSKALLRYVDDEAERIRAPAGVPTPEGDLWRRRTREAAIAGTHTLFAEIVDAIRSVPERGGGSAKLLLE